MRERRGGAEKHQRAAAKIHLGETGGDQSRDVLLRHSSLNRSENLAVDVERSLAGETHEFEFMRRFARAASDGDGIGGDKFESWRGGAKMIVEREGKSLVDADAAGAKAAIGERSGNELGGALVFLPDADFDGKAELFAGAAFFEGGRDKDWFAGARKDEGEEAFGEPPVDASEVVEGSAGAEDKGVEFGIELRHPLLGVDQAPVKFFGSDGMDAVAERFER